MTKTKPSFKNDLIVIKAISKTLKTFKEISKPSLTFGNFI